MKGDRLNEDTPEPIRPKSKGPYVTKLNRFQFQKGYEAHKAGEPMDSTKIPAWIAGWTAARKESEQVQPEPATEG